jgi:hypothetical protein
MAVHILPSTVPHATAPLCSPSRKITYVGLAYTPRSEPVPADRPFRLLARNASDFLIGAAYALIPFGLVSFLSERRDVQFGWLAWCFALFIALCGATHWMHIWLQFFPHDTAEAYLKAATALASVTTAGAVIGLLPTSSGYRRLQ